MAHDPAGLTLCTARLVLRPWRRADLDEMAAWPPFLDPLDQGWNWPRRLRHNGTLDFFYQTHVADRTRGEFTILAGDAVAGLLQLKKIRVVEGDAELGIAFGAPYVGRGYGREILGAFLEDYFDRLGFRSAGLEVALSNLRARRLYERLDFRETARFWRDAGPAYDYRFLDAPDYAAVRPFFRRSHAIMYQQFAAMSLAANPGRS